MRCCAPSRGAVQPQARQLQQGCSRPPWHRLELRLPGAACCLSTSRVSLRSHGTHCCSRLGHLPHCYHWDLRGAMPHRSAGAAERRLPHDVCMTPRRRAFRARDLVPTPLHAFAYRLLLWRLMIGFGKIKFTGTNPNDRLYIKNFCINMYATAAAAVFLGTKLVAAAAALPGPCARLVATPCPSCRTGSTSARCERCGYQSW